MSAQILHTTLIRDRVVLATPETIQVDLPVNPLSAIIVTLKAANNGASPLIAQFWDDWDDKYTSWRVTYRGATIIQGNTADLWMAMALRERQAPSRSRASLTDNDIVSVTFPLLFGRRLYDAMECFPATRRGDLVLEISTAADAGELDTHILQVETIELLDARPTRFLKVTTITQAMAAAGANEIELPIGNKLLGCLLRPFVVPTVASFNSSFGVIALSVDNVEVMEARRNWESAQGMLARRIDPTWHHLRHTHEFEPVAGIITLAVVQAEVLGQAYAYLDWDPLNDSAYMLDTRGAARVNLEIESDTADGANTSRVLPIEYVEIGGGGAA